ncbi:uncharacterized protein LOC119115700 [Syngnathus acus]|uniref:uncharacterized protein LOC119115700 n=1 Tax=Syngnathus acus TaxID=161584 RepID=UPI001885CCB9|nr:uncharacterized protein LOC119115700 [Syngnathus acus]
MDECVDINRLVFFLINGPLVLFSFAVNVFLLFFLVKPQGDNNKRLKLPLKILLEYVMCCAILYTVFLTLFFTLDDYLTFTASFLLWLTMQSFVRISMTSYVWLNFYFFLRIVPTRCALLIWLKRNIMVAILMVAFLDFVILVYNWALETAIALTIGPLLLSSVNSTVIPFSDDIFLVREISFVITWIYLFIILWFMIVTSCITVRYLRGHMRSVAKNGIALPGARLRTYFWVTTTGISQCVVFFFCAHYYFLNYFTLVFPLDFYIGFRITYTTSTVYVFCTTLNLCIGQSMFRQKLMIFYRALKSMCWHGNK